MCFFIRRFSRNLSRGSVIDVTRFPGSQVCRGEAEHVLQRRGPTRGERPWRPTGDHLRQPDGRSQSGLHLQGAPGPGESGTPPVALKFVEMVDYNEGLMSLISILDVDVECDQSWNPLLVCPQVSRLAGVLVKNGVQRGDLVVIYMPMVPQAMIAMLACARIGAPHSLIFGGFASRELSVRIDHAKVRKKKPNFRSASPDAA